MDQALKGLLFKEWKMMKGFLVGKYAIAILIIAVMSIHDDIIITLSGLLTLGFIIIPASILFSLNMEVNQMQAFLHNPHSAHKLLGTKLIYSVSITAVFLSLVSLSITGVEIIWNKFSLGIGELILSLLFSSLTMIIISLFIAIILLFFWTLHQIWRTYIGGLSIIVILILLIIGAQLESYFGDTVLYQNLTQWGPNTLILDEFRQLELGFITSIPFGTFVFYGFITIILYFISAYLLNHKVEV